MHAFSAYHVYNASEFNLSTGTTVSNETVTLQSLCRLEQLSTGDQFSCSILNEQVSPIKLHWLQL